MLSVMVVLSDPLYQEQSTSILGNLNNSPEPKAPPIVNQEYAVMVSHKM